jgi:hypothetical protein
VTDVCEVALRRIGTERHSRKIPKFRSEVGSSARVFTFFSIAIYLTLSSIPGNLVWFDEQEQLLIYIYNCVYYHYVV